MRYTHIWPTLIFHLVRGGLKVNVNKIFSNIGQTKWLNFLKFCFFCCTILLHVLQRFILSFHCLFLMNTDAAEKKGKTFLSQSIILSIVRVFLKHYQLSLELLINIYDCVKGTRKVRLWIDDGLSHRRILWFD